MGNNYRMFCADCKTYIDLDSELVWWQDKKLMYNLKDFLLAHPNHNLKIGGDQWNCAYDDDFNKQLPTESYIKWDSSASEQDYENDIKAQKEVIEK